MATRPIPENLEQLIDQVNCLPYNKPFPEISPEPWKILNLKELSQACSGITELLDQYPAKDYPEFTEETEVTDVRKVCSAVSRIKKFPRFVPKSYKEKFQDYRDTLKKFAKQCTYLTTGRSYLQQIAMLGMKHHPEKKRRIPEPPWKFSKQSTSISPIDIPVQVNIAVNSEAKVMILLTEELENLGFIVTGLDASRVRTCQRTGCGRIFWAGRLTANCCSKKCNNTYWKSKKRSAGSTEASRKKQREYQREYRRLQEQLRRRKK